MHFLHNYAGYPIHVLVTNLPQAFLLFLSYSYYRYHHHHHYCYRHPHSADQTLEHKQIQKKKNKLTVLRQDQLSDEWDEFFGLPLGLK